MASSYDLDGLTHSFQNLKCFNGETENLQASDSTQAYTPAYHYDNNRGSSPGSPTNQLFHSFLCLDFESTCINSDDPNLDNPTNLPKHQLAWLYPNEIIEWPVVLLQWRISTMGTWELYEVDRYRRFVRPRWRPILSQFCTDLTGISQDDVDEAMTLKQVLYDFDKNFVIPHKLFTKENRTVWVTDGPWDFRDHFVKSTFLSAIHHSSLPKYLQSPIALIDLRYLLKAFIPHVCRFQAPPTLSLINAMTVFGLEFEGHQHSGIDDAHNIARLLCQMVKFSTPHGSLHPLWTFRINKCLVLNPRRYFWMSKNFQCTWTLP